MSSNDFFKILIKKLNSIEEELTRLKQYEENKSIYSERIYKLEDDLHRLDSIKAILDESYNTFMNSRNIWRISIKFLSNNGVDKLVQYNQLTNSYLTITSSFLNSDSTNNKSESLESKNFTGIYRGKKIELINVKILNISYTKRNSFDKKVLRNEFNNKVKKDFIKDFANKNQAKLKDMGFSKKDIAKMLDGKVPKGYQCHHKLPLDDGGNNNFDNLILIKNDPYHKVLTNYQNSTTRNLLSGESVNIDWPIPEGDFYNGY